MDIRRLVLRSDSRQIRQSQRDIANLRNESGRAERAVQSFGSATQRLTQIMGALGLSLGAVQMVRFAQNTLQTVDELGKLSRQLGVSTQALQSYNFAAGLSGVRTESLRSALQRLTRNIGEARTGTGAIAQAFQELGIRTTNTESAFRDIANAIRNAKDESEAATIAYRTFGREGLPLVRMLRDGAAGLDEFTSQAERLGLILSDENIRRAERFNDQVSVIRQIFSTAIQRTFLEQVNDDLTGVSHALGRFMARIADIVDVADKFGGPLGMGVIGRILFGWRGAAIFAMIGMVSDELSRMGARLGLGSAEEQLAQRYIRAEENLEEQRRLLAANLQIQAAGAMGADAAVEASMRAVEQAATLVEELGAQLADNTGAMDRYNQAMSDFPSIGEMAAETARNISQALLSVESSMFQTAAATDDFYPSLSSIVYITGEAVESTETLRDQIIAMRDALRPAATMAEQYAEAMAMVEAAAAEGAVSTAELDEVIKLLKDRFAETAQEADPFADAWTGAISQIDGAFQTFLTSGLRDFKSFGDSLMQIAQQVAAQIVSTFVRAQLQSAMATQASGGATQAVGAVGQAAQGAASAGLFGLSAGATAGLAVGASLLIGALQRRAQRRREEREQLRSLEAREREIEAMIRSVGGLEDLTEQRARELERIRPANRELQERIFRLEDELRVARERQSLEERAFRLMGNTAALREIELRQTEAANRGLLRYIFALEDAAIRVQQAEDRVRQAFAGVERAVQAENDRLREQQREIADRQREAEQLFSRRISSLTSTIETLRRRGSTAMADPLAERAQAFAILSIAQAMGLGAISEDQLEGALEVVARPSEDLFASFEDYQRDFLMTKRVLEAIESQAQGQHSEVMTESEKQLQALQAQIDKNDEILEQQRRAVNALFGIDDSVRSVEDAVNNLQGAMREFAAASRAQAGLIAGGIPRPPGAPGAPAAPAGPGLAELQAKGRIAAQMVRAGNSLKRRA
jgi:hypothetical protein